MIINEGSGLLSAIFHGREFFLESLNINYRFFIMKYIKYIAVGIAIFIVLVSIFYFQKSEAEKENKLSVDAMYLLKRNETKEYVNATAIIYLTNLHAESGEIKIIVYLMERWKGVAIDKRELEIGKLQKDKTEEIQIDVQMENKSYDLEILVFENDLLKIKGNGGVTVYLYNAGKGGYRYEVSLDSLYFEKVHE